MTDMRFDLATLLRDPGRHFRDPQDVIADRSLDRQTKLDVLEHWERDARALAVAEEEGLAGGEPSMLGRVRHARRALGAETAARHSTTKHG